jgi:hypothetical protein
MAGNVKLMWDQLHLRCRAVTDGKQPKRRV